MSEVAVLEARPPCRALSGKFRQPRLHLWSMREAAHMGLEGVEADEVAREARITALGMLLESSTASSLWQRVVWRAEQAEIKARTPDRIAVMELALMESLRQPKSEAAELSRLFGDHE